MGNKSMKYVRVFLVMGALLLSILACRKGDSVSSSDIILRAGDEETDACLAEIPLDFLDLDSLSGAPVLGKDGNLNRLQGEGITLFVQDNFPVEQTHCGAALPPSVKESLDQVQQLIADGNSNAAIELLEELIETILSSQLSTSSTPHLASPALGHDGGRTMIAVRVMLTVVGDAQAAGDQAMETWAWNRAREIFEPYGWEEIKMTDNWRVALGVVATAQSLGLSSLADAALEKARDLVDIEINRVLDGFKPCTSTESDVIEMLTWISNGQMIGAPEAENRTDEALSLYDEWQDIQDRRAKGEDVEECIGNAFELNETFSGGLVIVTGSAMTCDGNNWTIEITVDANVEGAVYKGIGSTSFTVQNGVSGEVIIPTNGTAASFSFQDPITFGMTISEDGGTVEIGIGSTGSGTLDTPIGPLPFVLLPGGFTTVPLIRQPCDG